MDLLPLLKQICMLSHLSQESRSIIMVPLKKFKTLKLQNYNGLNCVQRSNGNLHTIKCRICNEVEGKINCLLLNEILFESMHVTKKLTRILELMWRKGIGITSKFVGMVRTKNCIIHTIVKVLLPKLQLRLWERKQKRLCNLP
jgi:hypothetical protein